MLSDFDSTLTTFAALVVFDSDFLFVTGAFGFSRAGFATARDEDLALDEADLAAVFGTALTTAFVAALIAGFALLDDWTTAAFFSAGFAIDLLEAGLVAATFAFFAGTVVFADFFITFAMK